MTRRSSRPLPVLAALACAGHLACAGSETTPRSRGAAELSVTRGDLTTRMLLTGELIAEDAERLVVPNANIWPVQIRWLAEDGIEVKKGDKLVEFDNSQLAANLEDLRAEVIEAANRLVSRRARAASDEDDEEFRLERKRAAVEKARLEAEVPAGVLAERGRQELQLDYQQAEMELAEAESQLEAQRRAGRSEIEIERIKLARAEAEVARSEERLELLTLHASRDGILVLESHPREGRPLHEGDGVFPGSVVGRLPDLSTMMVAARLFDVDDGRVVPGMRVVATLDAFPEVSFAGTVREIDQIADQSSPRSPRRFFRTKIDLDRVDVERMRPGMSVKVLIEQRHEDVLLVPRESLDWSAQGPRAFKEGGIWASVSLGACDAMACVVESGLDESVALARVDRDFVSGRDAR